MTSGSDTIYLAPLQGFTDSVYRKLHHRYFGEVEAYYIPYISPAPGDKIRNSQYRDILPENNEGVPVVPQVLCATPAELVPLADRIASFGYKRINLNLGCPYPMATNRGRGSALTENAGGLQALLDALFGRYQFEVSVKFRAGMTDKHTIFNLAELLAAYPIAQYTFHPRTADQLYKGEADRQLFAEFAKQLRHPVVYNGDIRSEHEIGLVRELVPEQNKWMIGRGVLANPFLPAELTGKTFTEDEKFRLKQEFHQAVYDEYRRIFSDNGQVLMKMKAFWTYFAESFSNPHKTFKLVKKAGSLKNYELALVEIYRKYAL